ncbi:hypothetical protein Clacol_004277 [Clathrus columnatus]|uniref:Uncharacterized protein n=1 Tax=Clathrus columnatus TaxID=1419009 RepID=A0AAV5A5Y4_9AGAM|nr:hypothetical protein Clacol_004277 [Clathrus columnatus]
MLFQVPKEHNPAGALKAFRAIVDAKMEKGDCDLTIFSSLRRPAEVLGSPHQAIGIRKVGRDI